MLRDHQLFGWAIVLDGVHRDLRIRRAIIIDTNRGATQWQA
jgi:hypothetical protein